MFYIIKGTAVVVITSEPAFNYRPVHNSQRYPNKFLWFITWKMFLSETMLKSDIFIRCVCRLGREISSLNITKQVYHV